MTIAAETTPHAALASEASGPITAPERIGVLDSLRGFALLGIFIANLASFTGWMFMSPEARAALPTAAFDHTVRFVQEVLVHGKFYTLFSLLFGIGFAVQLTRADQRGDKFQGWYVRRLLVLLAIGLVHIFIWSGDILLLYALCGFLLLPFRDRSDRTLLIWAVVLILLPAGQYALAWLSGGMIEPSGPLYMLAENAAESIGSGDGPYKAYAEGSLMDVMRANVVGVLFRCAAIVWEGREFKVLGVFLLGLWAGRRILAGTLLGDTRLLRRIFWIGIVVGLPANVLLTVLMERDVEWPLSGPGLLQFGVYALGVVPLGLAYAAGFALLWRRENWQRLLGLFAPAGRLALTCYLGQTLMGIGLFYGIVLGWMGTLGPTGWTVLALVLFAGQVALSALWLRHFRYGPMEWLWRRLSYGHRLPAAP